MGKIKKMDFREIYAKLIGAGIGLAVGLFLAFAIPKIYYDSFYNPSKEVEVINVELLEEEYEACKTFKYLFTRNVKKNINGKFVDELILIREGQEIELTRFSDKATLQKGLRTLVLTFKLPCDLDPGTYYIYSNTIFEINGREGSFNFTTPSFRIKQ